MDKKSRRPFRLYIDKEKKRNRKNYLLGYKVFCNLDVLYALFWREGGRTLNVEHSTLNIELKTLLVNGGNKEVKEIEAKKASQY